MKKNPNIQQLQAFLICYSHNDVVDGDVNELDKETDETHDGKPNCCGHSNLLKL